MKYIIFTNRQVIIFSRDIEHRDMAEQTQGTNRVLSAGFVTKHNDKIKCYGKSTSLDIDSRPEHDKAIIETFLSIGG
jgi:hypothetical protein